MKNPFMISMVIVFMILFSSCRHASDQHAVDQPAGSDGWLAGDIQQKFETIANQFAGFGKTMWETDYRFHELYWAGKDLNWEYAEHQIEELEETFENGLERRPVRAASAQQFLTSALPELEKAVIARDPELFEKRFLILTNTCNSCHALEEMPFITVKLPQERRSSIR